MFFPRKFALATVAVASIVTVSQSSAAIEICLDLYRKAHETIDQAYQREKSEAKNEQAKAAVEMNLLNETFTPMMFELKNVVSKLNQFEIRKVLREQENNAPLIDGKFEGDKVAKVPDGGGNLQRLVNYNAGQATRFYQVHRQEVSYRYQDFVYRPIHAENAKSLGTFYPLLSSVITPVGSYGKEFAQDMARTAEVLSEIAIRNLKDDARATYNSAPELLKATAQRVRYASSEKSGDLSPLTAVVEGIVSFHQLVNLMLANKIPGVENGPDALRAIVHADSKLGLASEVTMQVPMGFTAPSTYSGYGWKNALYFEGNRLMLSPHIKEYLKGRREVAESVHRGVRRKCPVAAFLRATAPKPKNHEQLKEQESGIQIIAEAYLKVFEAVQAQRLAREQYASE